MIVESANVPMAVTKPHLLMRSSRGDIVFCAPDNPADLVLCKSKHLVFFRNYEDEILRLRVRMTMRCWPDAVHGDPP
jgi:hypothetical protein